MVFIIKDRVTGQGSLETRAQAFIGLLVTHETQASKKPPGVGVDHKNRAAECVQDHIIGRLWPDPVDVQEPGA
jgi:hypothetical protein